MKIKTENLTYIYKKGGPFEKKAIDNVNLEINAGEFVGIIGHTGSGKSTLIQHLNGILKPNEGTVYIDGTDIFDSKTDIKEIRKKVGLVFQYPEYQLFEETVEKDIAFGLKNYGFPKEEIEDRVKEAISLVGLDESILKESPFDLSGGQKRRVALAGVIAMNPSVLVLDEPAAGLDPQGREEIFGEIYALHKKKGITVILVSHSMEDIARYANRIVVMHEGQVFMDGTPQEIFIRQEELEKTGLDAPVICKILNSLKKIGYNVKSEIFTTKEASEEILKVIGETNA